MCNKEHLVGYVYRELTAQEMAVFESHIRECADCRTEVEQLVGTRQHLASWSPPQPDLDFTVVRTAPAAAAPRRPVLGFVPQWTLSAAAAALLVAGAAAVANLELRYDAGGFVLRTGWSAPAQAANGAPVPSGVPAARQAVAAVESSEQVRAQLVALSERLRQLEQAEANHLTKASGPSVQEGISVAQLRRILDELEARQRTEMALQIGQVWRDFNAARANDAAYFQKTLGQAQGLTNYQLRQHRDSIESLYRVSQLK